MATKACTKCHGEKDLEDFSRDARRPDGRRGWCRGCQSQSNKDHILHHPPTTKRKKDKQAEHRWRHYGLSAEQHEAILIAQNHVCAACFSPPTSKTGRNSVLHVDHDHITGKIRALICNGCNVALGMIRENPERLRLLAKYADKIIENKQ